MAGIQQQVRRSSHLTQYMTHQALKSRLQHVKKYDPVARLMGIDIGRKYFGVSISDKQLVSALALKTLVVDVQDPKCLDEQGLMRALKNIIRNKHVKGLVIGYPLDEKGMPTRHC